MTTTTDTFINLSTFDQAALARRAPVTDDLRDQLKWRPACAGTTAICLQTVTWSPGHPRSPRSRRCTSSQAASSAESSGMGGAAR